ncbi:MAG: transglutaminase domain-containing protein [Vicinamibacterales bacterium]
MRYAVKHVTRFAYESPIAESVMEVRMQPRSEGAQRCLQFALGTTPGSRVLMHVDHDGNTIHHFNIPGSHSRLTLTATALVDCDAVPSVPHRLGPGGWTQLDAMSASGEHWEWLSPSTFTAATPLLGRLADDIGIERGHCPLVMLRRLMGEMYKRFEYSPRTTRVDSPIDEALGRRQGVCQDFTHIFIALARGLGVPTRYVSGYLFPNQQRNDRSVDGATHAWAEALLPELGWVGFDPTNNLLAEDRHIRVAVGRDYADVPPTRGVFKGTTVVKSELAVSVRIGSIDQPRAEVLPFAPWTSRDGGGGAAPEGAPDQQQ